MTKNLLSLMLFSLILSACGGPSGSKGDGKSGSNNGGMIEYAPLFAIIEDGEIKVEGNQASFSMIATRREFAAQPIIVKNKELAPQTVTINSTLDSKVEVVNGCSVALERNRMCLITLYYNRSLNNPLAVSAAMGSLSIASGALSKSFAVSAGVSGDTAAEEATESITINKTSISFPIPYKKGETRKDFITLRNGSVYPQPVIIDSALMGAESGFSIENNCGAEIASRRICVIVIDHDSDISDIGSKSASIIVAGQTISMSAVVEPAPIYTSNPNMDWSASPASSVTWNDESTQKLEFDIENSTTKGPQGLLVNDFNFGLQSSWASGFSWSDNGCIFPIDRNRVCHLSVTFDPEMFHFGVSFTKDAFIKDTEVSFELTGNSPCNPSHPSPRPGAALGKKLNPTKTACIDNLGVFDSPDSVFGHTVFQ